MFESELGVMMPSMALSAALLLLQMLLDDAFIFMVGIYSYKKANHFPVISALLMLNFHSFCSKVHADCMK